MENVIGVQIQEVQEGLSINHKAFDINEGCKWQISNLKETVTLQIVR